MFNDLQAEDQAQTYEKILIAAIEQYENNCEDEHQVGALAVVEFCKEHGLNKPSMYEVANGKRNTHKGFVCEAI